MGIELYYYLLYTPPSGFGFTRHDADDNSEESIDSDAVAPMVALSVFNVDLQGAASSNPAWSCTTIHAGGICTITMAALNAGSAGSLAFVVNLKGPISQLPEVLDLPVGLVNGSPARTQIVTLGVVQFGC